jgi:hypothetical protein
MDTSLIPTTANAEDTQITIPVTLNRNYSYNYEGSVLNNRIAWTGTLSVSIGGQNLQIHHQNQNDYGTSLQIGYDGTGTYNGDVIVCDDSNLPNYTGSNRTITVSITVDGTTATYSILQSGTVTVNATYYDYGYEDSGNTLNLTGNPDTLSGTTPTLN